MYPELKDKPVKRYYVVALVMHGEISIWRLIPTYKLFIDGVWAETWQEAHEKVKRHYGRQHPNFDVSMITSLKIDLNDPKDTLE